MKRPPSRRPGTATSALVLFLALASLFPITAAHAAGAPAPELRPASPDEEALAAFASVEGEWGNGVEASIERAYRACFRTVIAGGRIFTLRMPFAQNEERSELAAIEFEVTGGGKADPRELWIAIDAMLGGEDFKSYLAALSDGREKIISFDIASRTWTPNRDRYAIERMRSGSYQGLPHRPAVLASGRGVEAHDIYNYLYCVGRVGMDCSGFVWHVLCSIAADGGFDIERALVRSSVLPRGGNASSYVGTWFYDPRSGKTRVIPDEIRNLVPGDILLFRGQHGSFIHSAVIQSVNLAEGRIRYVQSTDESPRDERGVHDSLILFDPAHPELSIKDPSVRWLQLRGATFEGEPPPPFPDDGARFRAYPEEGAGVVVRLKVLEKTIDKLRKTAKP